MSKKHIVIVTDEFDTTADAVILHLRGLGYSPFRLHPRDFTILSHFSVDFSENGVRGILNNGSKSIALEDIGSVLWRRPKGFQAPGSLNEWEAAYVSTELHHAVQGLWSSLDCYWMSFPASIKAASWKPGQLKRAAAVGFTIPRTLVTTQPEAAREFYERCGRRIIYKPFSGPLLAKGKLAFDTDPERRMFRPGPDGIAVRAVYTTLLDETTFNRCLETVPTVPCLLQEYVEKKSELRVTIVGDDIFAAEIDSQAHERTRLDWRHYDVPMLMRKTSLPSDLVDKCFALVKGYGLNYSALDLILTPDDQYVFLESNPNGQSLFLQHYIPEYKILDAICSCLTRHVAAPSSPKPILAETIQTDA